MSEDFRVAPGIVYSGRHYVTHEAWTALYNEKERLRTEGEQLTRQRDEYQRMVLNAAHMADVLRVRQPTKTFSDAEIRYFLGKCALDIAGDIDPGKLTRRMLHGWDLFKSWRETVAGAAPYSKCLRGLQPGILVDKRAATFTITGNTITSKEPVTWDSDDLNRCLSEISRH